MEINIEPKKHLRWNQYDYSIINIKHNKWSTLELHYKRDVSNCKIAYIHNIYIIKYLNNDIERKELIDRIFNIHDQVQIVFITTNNDNIMKFLLENYKVISCLEIPIGYDGTNQYHISIYKNNNNDYSDRFKNEKIKEHINHENYLL